MDPGIIAQRLKEARAKLRIGTVDEAAKILKLPASTLYKYEAGTPPGAVALTKIAKGYNVSVDWILGLRDDMSGLPVGKAVIRDAVIQAVLEATCAEDVDHLLLTEPRMIEWFHHVEPQSRVTDLEGWFDLKEKARDRIKPFLPELKKRWAKKLR